MEGCSIVSSFPAGKKTITRAFSRNNRLMKILTYAFTRIQSLKPFVIGCSCFIFCKKRLLVTMYMQKQISMNTGSSTCRLNTDNNNNNTPMSAKKKLKGSKRKVNTLNRVIGEIRTAYDLSVSNSIQPMAGSNLFLYVF